MLERAGVGLSFAIFRKLYPTKELATLSAPEIEALGREYRKWELIALPIVFGYIAATGYLSFVVLRFAGELAARSHPTSLFLVLPDSRFWMLPSLFLGIVFAVVPLHYTYTFLLGSKRYEEYTLWTNLRAGFDGWKVFRWLALFILCLSGLMVAAALRSWDAYHDDRMVIMRPWYGNSWTYSYNKIRTIARVARFQAPNGNIGNRPYYVIRFNDGFTWTSRGLFRSYKPDDPRDSAIFALVSARSGRPIDQIDLIDDLQP